MTWHPLNQEAYTVQLNLRHIRTPLSRNISYAYDVTWVSLKVASRVTAERSKSPNAKPRIRRLQCQSPRSTSHSSRCSGMTTAPASRSPWCPSTSAAVGRNWRPGAKPVKAECPCHATLGPKVCSPLTQCPRRQSSTSSSACPTAPTSLP